MLSSCRFIVKRHFILKLLVFDWAIYLISGLLVHIVVFRIRLRCRLWSRRVLPVSRLEKSSPAVVSIFWWNGRCFIAVWRQTSVLKRASSRDLSFCAYPVRSSKPWFNMFLPKKFGQINQLNFLITLAPTRDHSSVQEKLFVVLCVVRHFCRHRNEPSS